MSQQDPFVPAGDASGHGGQSAGGGTGSYGLDAGGNGSKSTGVLATIENRLPAVPAPHSWYGPPARPEILSAKPNPIELLHAVRRRWPLALGLGTLVAVVISGLLWYFMPVRYESFALLRISGQVPGVLSKSNTAVEEFTIFKRTQVQLILSNAVLHRTLSEPDISRLPTMQEHSEDPVNWLRAQLVIDYPDDSEVMRVAMKGKRPSDLNKIVNKVVEKYMSEIVQHEKNDRLEQESKLEKNYVNLSNDYESQLNALHHLQKVHKSASHESVQYQKKLAFEDLVEMLAERNRLSTKLSETSMSIMLMEARRDNPDQVRPSDGLIEMELNKDPIIAQSSQYVAQLQRAITSEQNRSSSAGNSSKVKKWRKELQAVEEQLQERKDELRPRLIEMQMASNGGGGHEMNLVLLAKQKDHLDAQYKATNEKIAKQAELLEGLEQYSSKVAAKQDELVSMQRTVADLRDQLNRIRVERMAPDRVTKVDDAVLANGSGDAVRKYLAVVFSGILGFALVVVGIAFIEFQARKVNSVHEVNDGLGIRVVGELPSVSGRTWRRIKGGKGPAVLKALMAERIDGTRTAIIHTTAIDPPRVVMVTSADPREGKTTTASQLAASLARSGRRTLLIDADVRNPGAHRVFDLLQEPGLCELLRGEAERDAVIHPTRTANLWLLPAGRCDLRSVQALSTSYLGTTIAALCVQFDYVIIDSGPVLKIADPLLIGQHVDAVILSVLRDVSKVPKVYEACERLRSVGITVLGSVVNGVNDDAARHGVELLMAETSHAAPEQAVEA